MSATNLMFGYNKGLPAGCKAAWGCRAIVGQNGRIDMVHDRISMYGKAETLKLIVGKLQHGILDAALSEAKSRLRDYIIDTREGGEHVLFTDGVITVKANTQGSHGYLYICAFLEEL